MIRLLREIHESEWTGECHIIELLRDQKSSPYIIQVMKSRRMRWAGRVACMGYRTGVYRVG